MMKKQKLILLFIAVVLHLQLAAQERKEIILKSEISEATVFINGAQVLRNKSVDLLPGKSTIRFTGLSPYIDAKSVQIKASGEVMVVSVNHQMNYLDSLDQSAKSKEIQAQLKDLSDKINLENTNKDIIKEELNFLNENKKIGGQNNGVSLIALKETANYYRERISALKTKDIEVSKKITELVEQRNIILNEQNQQGIIKPAPFGEVVLEVETQKATKANLELTYYVNNAGWYPAYDIRAIDIEKPIQLVYKANIRQNTGEDWKNIKLKVSSADPNLGNLAPQLKTYYLNYHTLPPRYDLQSDNNQVTGVVLEEGTNEPLIGTSIRVKGTTIGTVADMDGRFSLSIPQNASSLEFSFIGFQSKTLPISRSFMTVYMREDMQTLDEVVVVGFGDSNALAGKVAGINLSAAKKQIAPAIDLKRADIALPTAQVENQTAVEFEIKIPYSIKSDNKNTLVEVDRYELPADYEYYSVPKVNKDAFLLANIVDWEKYNLLQGEANIFFENTYIGKTILDVHFVSDTLSISLGRDKNVLVNREKIKDYNTKKFLGSKKEETREWKISVRNNKKQPIDLVILDQIPVSTTEEIEVNAENLSDGALNPETGQVKWKLELQPADRKELELKYKVKYPKSRTLTIE